MTPRTRERDYLNERLKGYDLGRITEIAVFKKEDGCFVFMTFGLNVTTFSKKFPLSHVLRQDDCNLRPQM